MMMSTRFDWSAGMRLGVVTHEMQFAREVGDHLVFMDGGRIVEQGVPGEVLANPREERTRRFLHRTLRGAFYMQDQSFPDEGEGE